MTPVRRVAPVWIGTAVGGLRRASRTAGADARRAPKPTPAAMHVLAPSPELITRHPDPMRRPAHRTTLPPNSPPHRWPARTRAALAAVLLAAAPALAQTGPASPARLQQAVDSVAARALGIPVEGISVAVVRGDSVLLQSAYGLADVEDGRPVTPETVFEIGSATKPFTAAAVFRLAEEGRLSLDDEVGRHLPPLRERAAGVTLRHLLSHTSGLARAWAVEDLSAPSSPQAVVDSLAARPVESAPGERYAYNNNGFILLGLVVEAASGVPYAEYLDRTFLRPLGLASVAPCEELSAERMARGYTHPTRGPAEAAPAPSHHPTVTFSAGALCATAGDLARWQRALASGRVVSPEGYQFMTTPVVPASGRPAPYGLGIEVASLDGRPSAGHGGATPGFVVEAAYLPGDSLGVAVLTNGVYAGSVVSEMVRAVARAALGLPQPAVEDRPLTPAERDRFSGTYTLGEARTLEVYTQGTHLRLQPPGRQVAARLLY